MSATVYLPDREHGYYRGTRFDWGGVVSDLHVLGHTLFAPWFSSIDPAVPDFVDDGASIRAGTNSAVTGPAEEFHKPIGYDIAKPGDTFLKVGVGLLRRVDDKPYSFTGHYGIADGGVWKTRSTRNTVTTEQTLGLAGSDYAYVYTKTIRLEGTAHRLILEHRLYNTGTRRLQSDLYNHNFLTLDGLTVGRGYRVTMPQKVNPDCKLDGSLAKLQRNVVVYLADLHKTDRVLCRLEAPTTTSEAYDIRITNARAHFKVVISGDHPTANVMLWSIRSVLAVEPFIGVDVKPGKVFSWKYTYEFGRFRQDNLSASQ